MFSKPYALNAGNKRVGLDERSWRQGWTGSTSETTQSPGEGLDFGSLLLQVRERSLTTLTASMQRMTVFLELIPLFYWET